MGFPAAYTAEICFHALSLLSLLRNLTLSLLHTLTPVPLHDPPHTNPSASPSSLTGTSNSPPASATLIRQLLPAIKYTSHAGDPREPNGCAVCLCEFEVGDEVRELRNCGHEFHVGCLDRWMDCDRRTCPLCRTQLVPLGLKEEFDRQSPAASADYPRFGGGGGDDGDLYGEFGSV